MKNTFTKKDLQTGDIIICRDNCIGVVILEKDMILFQNAGYDTLDMYTEELLSEEDRAADIMVVYRAPDNHLIGFEDFEDGDIVFRQEYDEEDAEKLIKSRFPETGSKMLFLDHDVNENEAAREESIFVITQAFYGNRTGTYINPSEVDRFIWGHLTNTESNEKFKPGRKIVPLPGSDHLVLIYNERQEEKRRKRLEEYVKESEEKYGEKYIPKPLAVIPELDFEIFSRCIVCRIDPDGTLKSLEEGDGEILVKYLPL